MNQPPTPHLASVAGVEPVSDDLFQLTLEVAPLVAKSFTIAGQFHQLRVGELEARPFAIASAPGSEKFEYLVRKGFPLANALSLGDTPITTGLAEGPGFPLEASRGRDLLMITTGTGLAPMRSVIDVVRHRRLEWGRVTLLLGGRRPTDFGWRNEWKHWERSGITVVPTVLHPEPGWTGEHAHLVTLVPSSGLEKTSVFLVGSDELVAEVRKTLDERGVASHHLHLNV
ncbi:MAG: hypothetical protein QM723_29285 [Myxococcaceae bacterium]